MLGNWNFKFLIFFFPFCLLGITIPSQDILYNALGTLIKERKIYHTGEGYFIVTPQTYFITNNLVREKNWWTFGSGEDPPSPPPITYLLSNDPCVESSPSLPVAHCKSCSCFSPHQTPSNVPPAVPAAPVSPSLLPEQNSVSVTVSECTGKSLKWPRPLEAKPAVQHQSTSTAADYQASELSKTSASTSNATGRKDKLGRKFGLSLFWRNGAKKEKPRKEYASFSGQFPPEEWPVRDEDDLNNLPRDLEHAIIKRINPELTVDNLTRHTVLMKKLEERRDRGMDKALDTCDKGVDKGMSTEILSYSRSRHRSSWKAGKRLAHKASRGRRRAHSSRDKSRKREKVKNKPPVCADDYLEREDLIPPRLRGEIPIDEPDRVEECGATEEKCLYKKRIENPFQTHPGKDSDVHVPPTISRQTRGPEKEDAVPGRGKRGRTGYRSKSWDLHRPNSNMEEGEQAMTSPTSEDRSSNLQKRDMAVNQTDMKVPRELPPDYSSAYPQSSTLRMDDKVRQQRGVRDQQSWEGQSKNGTYSVLDQQPTVYEPTVSLPHRPTAPWPKPAFLSLRHSNPARQQLACEPTEEPRAVAVGNRQKRTVKPKDKDSLSSTDADGFFEDDRQLYQRAEEQEEEDTCSSLCLNEEDIIDSTKVPPAKYQSQQASSKNNEPLAGCYSPGGPQTHLTSLRTCRDAAFKDLVSAAVQRGASSTPPRRGDSRWRLGHHHQKTGSPGSRGDGGSVQAEGQPELNLEADGEDPSDMADESIFDYCQTSEMESDADTVRKSADEGDSQSVRWAAEAEKEQGDEFGGTCAPRGQRASPGKTAAGVRAEAGETENQSITGDSGIDSPR